jgi:cytoskeletal protein CcmA (bactofilin family)
VPDSPKATVIDGFTSVQAMRRIERRAAQARQPATPKSPAPVEPSPAAHFASSVMPQKYEITCYECGYLFALQGHVHDTLCPKCHRNLEALNLTIEGEWTVPVKTIGTVELKAGSVLKNVEINARDVILRGNAEDGTLVVTRRLEVHQGATLDIEKTSFRDLAIRSGGKFAFTKKIACRNLEVEGELTASIYSEGVITVRNGGLLKGEVHGPHLVIEEGGGLEARTVAGLKPQQ